MFTNQNTNQDYPEAVQRNPVAPSLEEAVRLLRERQKQHLQPFNPQGTVAGDIPDTTEIFSFLENEETPAPVSQAGYNDVFNFHSNDIEHGRTSTAEDKPRSFWDLGIVDSANMAFSGLGIVNGLVSERSKADEYKRMIRRLGRTDTKYNATNSPGVFGDYTTNTGLGSNFRPNNTTPARYEEGGEYTMTREELDAFIAAGGEVEIL